MVMCGFRWLIGVLDFFFFFDKFIINLDFKVRNFVFYFIWIILFMDVFDDDLMFMYLIYRDIV